MRQEIALSTQRRCLASQPVLTSLEPCLPIPACCSSLQPHTSGSDHGVSFFSFLSGSPASPMGDILQTPQFQMRRLKKQLADERNNRDELELELAENRKLLTEKGRRLARWQVVCEWAALGIFIRGSAGLV